MPSAFGKDPADSLYECFPCRDACRRPYFRTEQNLFVSSMCEKKMARSEVQRCLDWLCQQQGDMESASFGQGQLGVLEALAIQQSNVKDIGNFRRSIDETIRKEAVDEQMAHGLNTNYESVKNLSKKRSSCFETIGQIASLEELVQNLSQEFDSRAVHLVNVMESNNNNDETHTKATPGQSNESLARTAQNCISSVRKNWRWVFQVMQCAEVHLRNAAAYQQFFHEVDEAEYWMNTTLSRIHLSFDRTKLIGNRSDAQAIISEIKDVLAAYLQWQTKIDYLYDKAKVVVPVPKRINKLEEPVPAIALTDFSSGEISFIEGETLTLVDNSDASKWKVKNNNGDTGTVPAIIILIPAPSSIALDAAIRLRLQLLALWTLSVKRMGYQMIAFMLLVMRDWTEEEVHLLQSMSPEDREELLRILHYIEEALAKDWSGYGDFEELQERITRLKMILEDMAETNGFENGNALTNGDDQFPKSVVVQVKTLEDLLKKYKDFWTFWETFKCVAEMIKEPKFMLVCDKWEQLRFVTSAHFVRFWDTQMDLAGEDLTKAHASLVMQEKPRGNMGVGNGALIKEQYTAVMHSAPVMGDAVDGVEEIFTMATAKGNMAEFPSETVEINSEVTIEEETEETTTDTVTSTLEEEQHTYIITGVLDPRDDSTKLTLQNAIMLGIVDQTTNQYINPNNGRAMPMSDAMNEGRIIMEFVSRKKIREEQNSYGLITIKITKETRPYTITGVLDPVTETKMSVTDAVTKGVLDSHSTEYKTDKGDMLSIVDAIHSGLVLVEYHEGEAHHKPEIVTKTYAVHGVVDQIKRDKVSFADAVRTGLLDRDTGEYVNNKTNAKIGVQEAIMKGFIKARIVKDPSKLEVNPENTIIVEKLANAKQKLMRSVKALNAFKTGGK